MTPIAVEAEGLSKSFKIRAQRRTSLKERFVRGREPDSEVFWALRDASFVVPQGSSLGLIGQNGSGKSTALKVLAGIYRPTAGRVEVNGRVSALLEVGAGFHPELTGRENVRLNATILGFSSREIDRLMDRIIEFADIGEHIEAPVKHYSSGMYVRLGFAVAVMVRPQVLLVDEVIAVGDEEFQRKCFEYLYDLRRSGSSMIIVSHGLSQIADLCDEAILLDHGRVRASGPVDGVVRTYLDDVNQREIERSHPVPERPQLHEVPKEVPQESVEPRRGTGEIRITGVDFFNEEGTASMVLISGRPATAVMRYRATTNLSDVIVGIRVEDHADRWVAGVNTRHLDPWSVAAGEGAFSFRFDPLLLTSGSYRLMVDVLVGSHQVDALDDGAPFVVRPPDVEVAGVFLQPGSWSVETARDANSRETRSARGTPQVP